MSEINSNQEKMYDADYHYNSEDNHKRAARCQIMLKHRINKLKGNRRKEAIESCAKAIYRRVKVIEACAQAIVYHKYKYN